MEVEQSFEVAAPVDRVWAALVDADRVPASLPGATVGARGSDGGRDGEFRVKIGPSSATYSGRVQVTGVDPTARRVALEAAGTDKRGQGGARATIVCTVTESGPGSTRLELAVDYHITGRLARFGRGGTVEAILGDLGGEFAADLGARLADPASEPSSRPAPESAPASEPVPEPAPAPEPVPEPAPAPGPAPAPEPPASPGALAVRRVRENPAPLVALVVGFLVALRVLRRRG